MINLNGISPEKWVFTVSQFGCLLSVIDKNKLVPMGIISEQDIQDYFQDKLTYTSGLLPDNIIYIKSDREISSFVFQFNPNVAHIVYHDYDGKHNYELSLPWTQFVISISEFQGQYQIYRSLVCCTNKKIMSLDDTVYELPMNNIHRGDGNICWGGDAALTQKPGESKAEFAYRCALSFFTLNFNHDLAPSKIDEISSIQKWHDLSKEDPLFILNVKFKKLCKLRELI